MFQFFFFSSCFCNEYHSCRFPNQLYFASFFLSICTHTRHFAISNFRSPITQSTTCSRHLVRRDFFNRTPEAISKDTQSWPKSPVVLPWFARAAVNFVIIFFFSFWLPVTFHLHLSVCAARRLFRRHTRRIKRAKFVRSLSNSLSNNNIWLISVRFFALSVYRSLCRPCLSFFVRSSNKIAKPKPNMYFCTFRVWRTLHVQLYLFRCTRSFCNEK